MTRKQKDLVECLDTIFDIIARLGVVNLRLGDKVKRQVNKRLTDARRLILTGIEKGGRERKCTQKLKQ